MRVIWRTKLYALLTVIIMLTILPLIITVKGDPISTTLSVNPVNQTVDSDENLFINVYCVPGQSIKAFEFRLYFNANLLQADSVVEGNIFDNYTTFFNPGTIDNVAGTIVDVYGLILGSGNVSDPGIFVTINFTAKTTSGTSMLEFLDVGSWTSVMNETDYVPISVNSGSVEVQGDDEPSNPPSPPGPPPPFPPGPIENPEENHPPIQPMKPSGPTFVEMGIEYTYSSSTYDLDGDQIRYKFDWGDGNISEWSEFVDSNTTVSMSHNWSSISVYSVSVIAQDDDGLNSSWSPALNVTVSQTVLGIPPVPAINVSSNISVDESIVFDASDSYDLDGVIISYHWDFGDGETGSGISPVHVYTNPGEYTVILRITDNDGNIYNESMSVNVGSNVDESKLKEKQSVLPFDFIMIIIVSAIALIICLAVGFRHRIGSYMLRRQELKIGKLKAKLKK